MPINPISSLYSGVSNPLLSGLNSPAANDVTSLLNAARDIQSANRGLVGFNRQVNDSLRGLTTNVRQLSSAARNLLPTSRDNAFQLRAATSANNGVVTATADRNATIGDIRVQVSQLATAQTNTGAALNANDTTDVQTGQNTIAITAGGQTRQITFNIAAGATNQQAITAVATAINQTADLGVQATVVTNNATGTATLQLRSAGTGTEAAFTVEDRAGNAVAAAGVANVQQAAQNARATVNGEQVESQVNQIKADQGRVALNLVGVSSKEVTVGVGVDNAGVAHAVGALAAQFNRTLDVVGQNSQFVSNSVGQALRNSTNQQRTDLRNIGIEVDAGGRINVNEQRLAEALNENPERVTGLLAGRNGLATNVETVSNRILTQSPSSFALSLPAGERQNRLGQYLRAQLESQGLSVNNLVSGLIINRNT